MPPPAAIVPPALRVPKQCAIPTPAGMLHISGSGPVAAAAVRDKLAVPGWRRSFMAAFDEMSLADGAVRPAYSDLAKWLSTAPKDLLAHRRDEAELLFRRIGITFAV